MARIFKKGMKDRSVGAAASGPISQIQKALVSKGFLDMQTDLGGGKHLGIYGQKTHEAVRKFQSGAIYAGQLPAKTSEGKSNIDGIVGPLTLGVLVKNLSKEKAAALPKIPKSRKEAIAIKAAEKRKAQVKKFKGQKREVPTFIKKAPASAKQTLLKSLAMGKLGVSDEFRRGATGQHIEAIKIWLVDKGFLRPYQNAMYAPGQPDFLLDYFDDTLVKTVKIYQGRLKIKQTGKIDQETAIAMMLGITLGGGYEISKHNIFLKVFGTAKPNLRAVSLHLKGKADMVDANYTKALSLAAGKKDGIFNAMKLRFLAAAKAEGVSGKDAENFFLHFPGLARAKIQKDGYSAWDRMFIDFALDPAMMAALTSNALNSESIRKFVSQAFDLDTLNAQTLASYAKAGSEDFSKKEKKAIRYLNGPNSYLLFNLEKGALFWMLAAGRKSGGSAGVPGLSERNYNDLESFVHPKDLIIKSWRATSGDLALYKKISNEVDENISRIHESVFDNASEKSKPYIRFIMQSFAKLGKAQSVQLRQERNLGPLPVGVYRVSDYQEKNHEDFEAHFTRNMSKEINKELKGFKTPEQRKLFFKLLKRNKFIPSVQTDVATTKNVKGKRYKGRKNMAWNVRGTAPQSNAWGSHRMWLSKLNVPDPKARTRSGFSIHGGAAHGSSGCIDLGAAVADFARFYKKSVGGSDILLVSITGNLPRRKARSVYLGHEQGKDIEGSTV